MRRRPLTLMLALGLTLLACPVTYGVSAGITVDMGRTYQCVAAMGGDMERSSGALMEAADPGDVVRWAFQDTGFSICRVQFDKHQEIAEGQSTFGFYDKQVTAMKLVKQACPDIEFFATQRSDYNGYKMGDGNNFPTWIYDPKKKAFDAEKHGRFLANYVTFMHEQGVPIRYLSTGKEITQVLDARRVVQSVRSMKEHLRRAATPEPLIVEPGAWSLPQAIAFIGEVEELGEQDLFYAYSSHNYMRHGEAFWTRFVEAATRAGGKAWNGESGMDHIDNGIAEFPLERAASSIADRFGQYRAGVHGEVFFEMWSRGIGRETRPIYFQEGQHAFRMRSYYLIKHWAKTVRGSCVVETLIDAPQSVDALAFRKNSNLYLWMVNLDSAKEIRLPLKLRGTEISSAPIETRVWSEETAIEGSRRWVHGLTATESGFALPAGSVTMATIALE